MHTRGITFHTLSYSTPSLPHRFPNPNRTDLSEIFRFGDPACGLTSPLSVFVVNNPLDEFSLLDETFGNAPKAIPTRSGVVRSLTPSLVVVDPEPAVDPEPSSGCVAGLDVGCEMICGRIPGTVS